MFLISLRSFERTGREGQLRGSSYLAMARSIRLLWQAGLTGKGA